MATSLGFAICGDGPLALLPENLLPCQSSQLHWRMCSLPVALHKQAGWVCRRDRGVFSATKDERQQRGSDTDAIILEHTE